MPRISITKNIPDIDQNINIPHKNIAVILNQGIGDVIYTWYKLIYLVNSGYRVHVKVGDQSPQRSHQILGCLEGMASFEYIPDLDYQKYWLVDVPDPRDPPIKSLHNRIPVLYLNSFLESNIHLNDFMSRIPIDYNIKILTNQDAQFWAKNRIDKNYFNITLYCSNYKNNIECHMHPDPKFWVDLVDRIYRWKEDSRPLFVNIIGADYDSDLSNNVFEEFVKRNIEAYTYISFPMYNIIEMLRISDFVVSYESGMGVLSDVMLTPCLQVFRRQGGNRDDKKFPYLGPINPDNMWKTFFPFFYDDSIDSIIKKINKL